MSADKNRYSEFYKEGDCFNKPDANPIVPDFDSGKGLSEHNTQVADDARKSLERE